MTLRRQPNGMLRVGIVAQMSQQVSASKPRNAAVRSFGQTCLYTVKRFLTFLFEGVFLDSSSSHESLIVVFLRDSNIYFHKVLGAVCRSNYNLEAK